ncbi:hypothetical protein MSAN_02298900 [Mycena sanguinolenta]|uniref:Transmembrane protein n=1 Tax=Mycena sanguinolenta TaxID=230812 RepID=A0A8H7CHS7_9AGAR|nr:hypothetical protein MSAN_02298900 [Mycena sanguinolenta]
MSIRDHILPKTQIAQWKILPSSASKSLVPSSCFRPPHPKPRREIAGLEKCGYIAQTVFIRVVLEPSVPSHQHTGIHALCAKLADGAISSRPSSSPLFLPNSSMRLFAIFNGIKSFRLGYTEESPYPWRWTTPIVLCVFLLISPFLALVNVPLSAYNIIQEATYQPNATLPAVFLGNLVPSVLQNPTESFTPQLLHVGDMIMLDDYIFNYTIAQAFDGVDTSKPVSTFSYYNNPLSDSCDVANITIQLLLTNVILISGPSEFWTVEIQVNFVVVSTPLFRDSLISLDTLGHPMQVIDLLAKDALGNVSISSLSTAFENLFQSFYHLVRLDLGVILGNQIYNSPTMFNQTIMDPNIFESAANIARDWASNATVMARWQTEVEFFQSNERVPPLQYLRPIPRLKPIGSALTSVFVSTFAILSVMWTVFSLVAGALARAHSGDGPGGTHSNKDCCGQSRMGDKWRESGTEGPKLDSSEVILLSHQEAPDAVEQLRQMVVRNDIETRIALARISAALKRRGLMEDESWDDDPSVY